MSAPATGRRVSLLLWPLMLAWLGYVGWRAHDELAADYTVEGLFRSYHAPYDGPLGPVVDPRPQMALLDEIARRYAPDQPRPAAEPVDTAGWTSALTGLGLTVSPHAPDDRWTGAPPRLRLPADGPPHLLIGLFGVDPVALVPGVGVVRILEGTLPPAEVDLRLVGAREPPW